jgi:hypothetical protein
MKIRELINILDLNKLAPIHFVDVNNNKKYIECVHMTEEEMNDFENNCWNKEKEYNQDGLGIYIPDITVEELYDLENYRNSTNLRKVINDISCLFQVRIDKQKIIFATYVVLHEIGHWINFKKSGMTSLEYSLWDSEFRKVASQYSAKVRAMPNNLPVKYLYAEKAVEMYKNIPSEKLADEYAFKNIERNLNILGIDTQKPY